MYIADRSGHVVLTSPFHALHDNSALSLIRQYFSPLYLPFSNEIMTPLNFLSMWSRPGALPDKYGWWYSSSVIDHRELADA